MIAGRMRRRDLFRIFAPGLDASRAPTQAPAVGSAPAAGSTSAAGSAPSAGSVPAGAEASSTAPAFSLDAFYARRAGAGVVTGGTIPAFEITARADVRAPRGGAAEAPAPPPWRRGAAGGALPPGAVPRLVPHACIARESFCSACVERCPAEGALVMELGRPKVDEERCTGCGRCVEVCPAPERGFTVVPRSSPEGARRHA
ncbi:4Fe-4S dicluster domain-containing protein [Sorangium sp. So ce1024]|uniref:4Fe-4S dicluster domain-containing protein n=1 Tax=Sorangium sp. So ce1024 TaxID=3133327 RepID=UPI003F113534